MTKKHASIDSANLGILIGMAKEMTDKEHEDKQRDLEAGRRNEIDDLPTGHPLKTLMETAKKRFEEQKQATDDRSSTIKVAKKATSQSSVQQGLDDAHRQRKASAQQYNDAVMDVLGRLEGLKGMAEDASRVFAGFPGPRVKLSRACRAMAAVCHAIHDSVISVDERG